MNMMPVERLIARLMFAILCGTMTGFAIAQIELALGAVPAWLAWIAAIRGGQA